MTKKPKPYPVNTMPDLWPIDVQYGNTMVKIINTDTILSVELWNVERNSKVRSFLFDSMHKDAWNLTRESLFLSLVEEITNEWPEREWQSSAATRAASSAMTHLSYYFGDYK